MTGPLTRIDGVRQQGCPIDADRTLVTAIAVDLLSASIWLVTRDGHVERIGKTPGGCPKIDSAWPRAFPDGTARLCMAQADVGGGGATSHLTWIDFPDAFPPQSNAAHGGGYVSAPGGEVQVFAKADWSGEAVIDLLRFGIPPCALVGVELTVSGVPRRAASVNGVSATVQAEETRTTNSASVVPGVNGTLTVAALESMGEVLVSVLWWQLL